MVHALWISWSTWWGGGGLNPLLHRAAGECLIEPFKCLIYWWLCEESQPFWAGLMRFSPLVPGGVKNTIFVIAQWPGMQLLHPFGHLFKYVFTSLLCLFHTATLVFPVSGDVDTYPPHSFSHSWYICFYCLQGYSHIAILFPVVSYDSKHPQHAQTSANKHVSIMTAHQLSHTLDVLTCWPPPSQVNWDSPERLVTSLVEESCLSWQVEMVVFSLPLISGWLGFPRTLGWLQWRRPEMLEFCVVNMCVVPHCIYHHHLRLTGIPQSTWWPPWWRNPACLDK